MPAKKLGRPFTKGRDKWFGTRASEDEIKLINAEASKAWLGQMDFIMKLVRDNINQTMKLEDEKEVKE